VGCRLEPKLGGALIGKSAPALGPHPTPSGADFLSRSRALSDEYQRIDGAHNPCSEARTAICTNPPAGASTTGARIYARVAGKDLLTLTPLLSRTN
jgi:hypothetical protein